jgi:hypothetical protein
MTNSEWLLKCLSHSFAFKTSEPLRAEGMDSGTYTFHLSYGSQLSRRDLENLLVAVPGVLLSVLRTPL